MAPRFLAFLLFGVLSLVAFDGFERQREQRESVARSVTSGDSAQAAMMDGPTPYPPKKF